MKVLKKIELNFVMNNQLELYADMINDDWQYKFMIHDENLIRLCKKHGDGYLNDLYNGGTLILTSGYDNDLIDIIPKNYDRYFNGKLKHLEDIIGIMVDSNDMINSCNNNHNVNQNILLGYNHNLMYLDIGDDMYETGLWYSYNHKLNHIRIMPYISKDGKMICLNDHITKLKYHLDVNDKKFSKMVENVEENIYNNNSLTVEVNEIFAKLLMRLKEETLSKKEMILIMDVVKDNKLKQIILKSKNKYELMNKMFDMIDVDDYDLTFNKIFGIMV